MAIESFRDDETKKFFTEGLISKKVGWRNVANVVRRKLDMINYADELNDLKVPPGNRLEALSGDLNGFYSIRINDRWRIIFRWMKYPEDVEVVDYH